jgi:hypothetical protein
MPTILLASCCVLIAAAAMNAAPLITYTGLPGTGIELVLPSSPEFASALTASLGPDALTRYQAVLQYSVIVKNATSEALWLVAVRVSSNDAGTRVALTNQAMTTSPLPGMSSLGPGAMVMLSGYSPLTRVLRPSVPRGLSAAMTGSTREMPGQSPEEEAARLAKHSGIDITLDCVVFADGGVIGPDEGHYMDQLIGQGRAQTATLSDILNLSADDTRKYLSPTADAPMPETARENGDPQVRWYERERWSLARLLLDRLNASKSEAEFHDFVQQMLRSDAKKPALKRRSS